MPSPTPSELSRRQNALLAESKENQRLLEETRFSSYLRETLRASTLWSLWLRLVTLVRRTRLILLLFRILSFFLFLLETGTVLLVSFFVFLVLLPTALFILPGLLLSTVLAERRTLSLFSKLLPGRRVTVLFLSREAGGFFSAQVRALAEEPGACILLVSAELFSGRAGIKKGNFYLSHRKDGDGIFLLRRHAFFRIQKNGLLPKDARIII